MNELPQKRSFWPKLSNKFARIYILLALPIFSTMAVSLFVVQDHVLKGKLLILQGLFLIIWSVFVTSYWEQIQAGFLSSNPEGFKLPKVLFLMMMFLLVVGPMAHDFVQDDALRGKLLTVQAILLLIVFAFYLYAWSQRRKQKEE